ncbi:MAG TPA: lamin tail domain-containing protein, partial [Candidatus Doudnabacteria bacterium]|nr:lamin tail domain-containing protein [Candidatus Doudnabacteria bacterium]
LMIWATAIAVAFGSLAGLAVKTVVAQTSPASLVISAVQITGGVGKTAEDFIELYNPNPFPVDLNGYRLVKRTATVSTDSSIKVFNTETLIPPHSFYLWANSGFTGIGVPADTTTSSTLADNNGVGLRFGALDVGQLIDGISWGTTDNGFVSTSSENPQAGESLIREQLFGESEYSISVSNPRNSNIQFLPEGSEELINDSICSVLLEGSTLTAGQNTMTGISFQNIGNSTWLSSGFSVRQQTPEGITDIELPNSFISPASDFDLAIQITAPEQVGDYTYTWQMQDLQNVFGDSCVVGFKVIAPEEEPEPTEPEPEPEDPSPEPQPNPTTVRINEFLPNPTGDDSGKEVIELYNYGSQSVNLSDWVLDDIDSWPASSNAYQLEDVQINAGAYLAITIPAGKFALNNTGGDVVTLSNPVGSVISSVTYSGTSPEGKTYSYVGGDWHWTEASLGLVNPALPEEPEEEPAPTEPEPEEPENPEQPQTPNLVGLIISEIYPSPATGDKEFVELFNGSLDAINLKDAKLAIGNRVASLPDFLLPSGGYYALIDAELKLPLADAGKTIKLLSEDGTLLNEVTYPKAKKGESYSLFDSAFMWTKTATPNLANQLETGAEPAPPEVGNGSGKVSVKAAAANILQKAAESLKQNANPPAENETGNSESGKKANPVNAIIVALASLFASAFAVYKFGM